MEIQWSLVIFAAFICWGAGTYVAAVAFRGLLGASERIMRPAFVLSAVAVVVGAVASMTHLGHLDRIFGVLSNPASGIFVEGLSSAVLVVVAAAYLVAAGRKASSGVLRALAVVGVVPALVVVFAVGSSYLMVARPAWDVPALPIASVTAALSMGAVTVLAIDAFTARGARDAAGEERAASRMDTRPLRLIGIQAVAVAAYAASVATAPYQEASRSAARMLAGDMAPLFWLAVVVLGVAVAVRRPRSRSGAAWPLRLTGRGGCPVACGRDARRGRLVHGGRGHCVPRHHVLAGKAASSISSSPCSALGLRVLLDGNDHGHMCRVP